MNKGWHMGLRLMLGAMVAAVIVGGTAGLASAQDSTDPYVAPSPTVESESAELQPAPPVEVLNASTEQAPSTDVKSSSLAFTGSDVAVIAGLGFAALIVGGLVLSARRRTTSA